MIVWLIGTSLSLDEALLQQSRVLSLPKPTERDITVLQEWLDRPEGGDMFLKGWEADTWDCGDLITLSSRQKNKDGLTSFVNDTVVPWYHRTWGSRFYKVCALRNCYER